MGVGASLDPRPGGAFRINVDHEHFAAGRYVEVEAPRRLLMTWGWEDSDSVAPGSTSVEIILVPDGAGTLLKLRHSHLPTRDDWNSHRDGWQRYLGNLRSRVAADL